MPQNQTHYKTDYGPSTDEQKKELSLELSSSKNKIGEYEIEIEGKTLKNDEIQKKVSGILGHKAQKKLFGKTKKKPYLEKKTAREKFIDELIKILNDPKKDSAYTGNPPQDPSKTTIKIKDLLGDKKILRLYKAAIEEENKSSAFRAVVFMRSLSKDFGVLWKQKSIVIVLGPGGAGKTSAAQNILKETADSESTEENQNQKKSKINTAISENLAIEVDGAISRKCSEIYKLTLKVALCKGYSGINDLDSNTKISVKGKVEAAAINSKTPVSLIVPLTCASPKHFFKIIKYATLKGFNLFLAEVKAPPGKDKEFQEQVSARLEKRAWGFWKKIDRNMQKNKDDLPCESKKNQKKNIPLAIKGAAIAKKIFRLFSKAPFRAIYNLLIPIQVQEDGTYIRLANNQNNSKGKETLQVTEGALKAFHEAYTRMAPSKEETISFFKRNAYLPEIIVEGENQKKAPMLQANPSFHAQPNNLAMREPGLFFSSPLKPIPPPPPKNTVVPKPDDSHLKK